MLQIILIYVNHNIVMQFLIKYYVMLILFIAANFSAKSILIFRFFCFKGFLKGRLIKFYIQFYIQFYTTLLHFSTWFFSSLFNQMQQDNY